MPETRSEALSARSLAALLAVTALALGLRLHQLDGESLFMDEIRQTSYYTANFLQMVVLAASQNQPPLDYWIGAAFSALGSSDFIARLPSALFGAGAVALLSLLTARLTDWRYGIAAGLILALLPFHVYFSQEARPYAGPMFWTLLWLFLTLLAVEKPKRSNGFYLGYLLVAIAFLFSRADTPLFTITAAIGLLAPGAILLKLRPTLQDRWGVSSAQAGSLLLVLVMAAAAYLPMLLYLVEAGKRYAPDAAGLSAAKLWQALGQLPWGALVEAFRVQWEPLPLAAGGLLLAGYLRLPKIAGGQVQGLFIGFLFLLLPVTAFIHLWAFQASTSFPLRPPYPTYLLPLSLLLIVLTVRHVADAIPRPARTWVSIPTGAALMALLGAELIDSKQTPQRTDWRGMAPLLKEEARLGDVVLMESSGRPGSWDPNDYGFDRYRAGGAIFYPASELQQPTISKMLAHSRQRRPFLLYFLWRDYRLSANSALPFITRRASDLDPVRLRQALSAAPELETRHRTGLLLLTLRDDLLTQDFARDSLMLLQAVLKALPRDPAVADLYALAARFAAELDAPEAEGLRLAAESLVRRTP